MIVGVITKLQHKSGAAQPSQAIFHYQFLVLQIFTVLIYYIKIINIKLIAQAYSKDSVAIARCLNLKISFKLIQLL